MSRPQSGPSHPPPFSKPATRAPEPWPASTCRALYRARSASESPESLRCRWAVLYSLRESQLEPVGLLCEMCGEVQPLP